MPLRPEDDVCQSPSGRQALVPAQPSRPPMKILHDYRHFPSSKRSSVTIGNFDGLHLGHRRILEDLVRAAAASDTCSVVMTFSPHPLQVLHPGKAPKLIVPTEDKIAQIESLGIDYLLLIKFDEALSRLSGEAFIREILVDSLRIQHVFVGHNFVFGHKRSGNVALLEALGREYGYTVHVIPPVEVRGSRVSSTWIRELIRSGQDQPGQSALRALLQPSGTRGFRPGPGKNSSLPYVESRSPKRNSAGKWRLRHAGPFRREKPPGSDQRRHTTDRFRYQSVGRDPSPGAYAGGATLHPGAAVSAPSPG